MGVFTLDVTTITGLLAGVACILISIFINGQIGSFIDLASVLIVVGGTVASTIISYPGKMLKSLTLIYKNAFQRKQFDLYHDIDMIIDIANIARREGLLALESAVEEMDNPFLKKGVMLIVDGGDPELVKSIMEAEIYFIQERHAQGQSIIDSMASYAPAYGMIGTLIGLINMLKNLQDSSTLGPAMAVALITTFYGIILANLLFIPVSKKLKVHTAAEIRQKELLLEGLLSIQDGENPRIIRDKLNAFLSHKELRKMEIRNASMKPETEEIPSHEQMEG